MKKLVKMVKIFILSIVLAMMMIPAMTCQAVDRYMGTYDDGAKAYVMTETIRRLRNGESIYNCTVKAVYSNSNFEYIYYTIQTDPHMEVTKNGRFYDFDECRKKFGIGTVEDNIANYIVRKNIAHEPY